MNPANRSFRLVASPEKFAQVEDLLAAEGFAFEEEPFSPYCRKLTVEPFPLGSSLAAFFGLIYIQDRSAMLPPLALNPRDAVLDVCASPGGKTSFLAQLCGDNALVLANEPNGERFATLRANLERLDLPNVCVSSYPGEKLPLRPESWPYILLDPPCSGWGTAEKHPRVRRLWQGETVTRLIATQRALLKKAASLLAPGGRLLYSTCTTSYDENEAQTLFAENELGLERENIPPFPGFVYETRPGGEGCLLVDGRASKAQGFYLSLLRKKGSPAKAPKPTPGEIKIFGANARFIPAASASLFPDEFKWQGARAGKLRGDGAVAPGPLARRFAETLALPSIIFEKTEEIKKLLSGATIKTAIDAPFALLRWRETNLGVASIKSGRIVGRFK